MRSIELINSVLAKKKSADNETKQADELKQAIDKLDNISATMEGIFNKLSAAPAETPKKTKAKKTEAENTPTEDENTTAEAENT